MLLTFICLTRGITGGKKRQLFLVRVHPIVIRSCTAEPISIVEFNFKLFKEFDDLCISISNAFSSYEMLFRHIK